MSKHNSFIVWVICMSLLFVGNTCFAQKLYKVTWKESGIVLGSSAAMFGGAAYIEDQRGLHTAEDIAQLDQASILGIDRNMVGNFSANAGTASDYFRAGAWVAPLTLFLSGQGRENIKEILFMYAEVFSLNGGLTNISKSGFGRYRPYAYNPNVDLEFKLQPTARRSFFSGHVSHVSSLSYFTATIFDDLYPDSDLRYVIWAGAITAPAVTGYLRVKAGRHFPTDVIVGYGVGALVGYFIPELYKITRDSDISIIGADGGLGLLYTF